MEKSTVTKGFYEYRTTLRALSDGVSLLTKNASMLLKATWPMLLLVSLAGAWFCYAVTRGAGSLLLDVEESLMDFFAGIALPFVLFLLGVLLFYALVFTLFSKYVEMGFMPALSRKRFQLCPKLTKLPRLAIGMLWMLFVEVIYVALSAVLATYWKWSLALTLPLYVFLVFWLGNQIIGYVLISETLIGSIGHSLKVTLKGFGSFLTVAMVLTMVLGAIGMVCLVPSVCSEIIFVKAQLSLAEGDGGSLPSYFLQLYFIICTFSTFLLLLLEAVKVCCWSMVYGAVDNRLKQKKANKLQVSDAAC